jgi:hypothetical protein
LREAAAAQQLARHRCDARAGHGHELRDREAALAHEPAVHRERFLGGIGGRGGPDAAGRARIAGRVRSLRVEVGDSHAAAL